MGELASLSGTADWDTPRRLAGLREKHSCRLRHDALRWWFACEVGAVADTDFTIERLIARANEDLATGWATSPTAW